MATGEALTMQNLVSELKKELQDAPSWEHAGMATVAALKTASRATPLLREPFRAVAEKPAFEKTAEEVKKFSENVQAEFDTQVFNLMKAVGDEKKLRYVAANISAFDQTPVEQALPMFHCGFVCDNMEAMLKSQGKDDKVVVVLAPSVGFLIYEALRALLQGPADQVISLHIVGHGPFNQAHKAYADGSTLIQCLTEKDATPLQVVWCVCRGAELADVPQGRRKCLHLAVDVAIEGDIVFDTVDWVHYSLTPSPTPLTKGAGEDFKYMPNRKFQNSPAKWGIPAKGLPWGVTHGEWMWTEM